MIIEYGKTPEETILWLLGRQNGIELSGNDVEFDYVTTTLGDHPPNSTITLRAKPGGKFSNLKTITFNRIDIGSELFRGITLKYTIPDGGSKTRWEIFSEATEKYHLPVKKSDILLPDTVVTNADLDIMIDMNPLTSMLLVGSIKLFNDIDFSESSPNHLKNLYPNTWLNAWNSPNGAMEALLQDADPPVPGVINHSGWLLSYNYAIDETTWDAVWGHILSAFGASSIEDMVGMSIGDYPNLPMDELLVSLFQMWGPWKLDPDNPMTPFNLYGATIAAYNPITATDTTELPKGSWEENYRRAPDVKYVMEFSPSSNYYGNVHGHITVYVY